MSPVKHIRFSTPDKGKGKARREEEETEDDIKPRTGKQEVEEVVANADEKKADVAQKAESVKRKVAQKSDHPNGIATNGVRGLRPNALPIVANVAGGVRSGARLS